MQIIQKPSPNFSEREGYKPEVVVIHVMAGTLSGTDSWFATTASQVSAHYGVGLAGEIHQYVQEDKKAWHAGGVNQPNFELYKPNINPNLYTIGIECEGDDISKNPDTQITAIANLVKDVCTRWNIPIDRKHIIGHYQINLLNRPNCPATDKKIIDRIISLAQPIVPPTPQNAPNLGIKGQIVAKLAELKALVDTLV